MTSRILVPLDGSLLSEGAIPVATWLAEKLPAEVTIVTVGSVPESADQEREIRAGIEKTLLRAEAAFPATVRVHKLVELLGDPARGVLQAAQEQQVDLIVMSTHGRSGLSELVQGSVASEVVRAGTFPVTLIRARKLE